MNSDASNTEALDRLIERWAARIGQSSGRTVEGILLQAENVLSALRELRPYGPQARHMLQTRSRLSQPTLSKLEAIGRHAELMRLRASKLPPSVSSLYALTLKPWNQFLKAIEVDLRGMSRSEIQRLFAHAPPPNRMCKLMTISIAPHVGEATRLQLIADIRGALALIAKDRRIELKGIQVKRGAQAMAGCEPQKQSPVLRRGFATDGHGDGSLMSEGE
jgi:hypothetical protein